MLCDYNVRYIYLLFKFRYIVLNLGYFVIIMKSCCEKLFLKCNMIYCEFCLLFL